MIFTSKPTRVFSVIGALWLILCVLVLGLTTTHVSAKEVSNENNEEDLFSIFDKNKTESNTYLDLFSTLDSDKSYVSETDLLANSLNFNSINLEMTDTDYLNYLDSMATMLSSFDVELTPISNVGTTLSQETVDILNMSDEELWLLISDGVYHSFEEANSAAQLDFYEQQNFWRSQMTPITVPCWTMVDGEITSTNREVIVNKHIANLWLDYFTDLYNLPEQYCIKQIGGFCYRTKNNGSGTSNLSAHSFGTAVDVNWSVDGMGSVPVGSAGSGIIGDGHTVSSRDEVAEENKPYVETLDSTWYALTKRYKLDWGGDWSVSSQDPMHHSIVGDRQKATREYTEVVDSVENTETAMEENNNEEIPNTDISQLDDIITPLESKEQTNSRKSLDDILVTERETIYLDPLDNPNL